MEMSPPRLRLGGPGSAGLHSSGDVFASAATRRAGYSCPPARGGDPWLGSAYGLFDQSFVQGLERAPGWTLASLALGFGGAFGRLAFSSIAAQGGLRAVLTSRALMGAAARGFVSSAKNDFWTLSGQALINSATWAPRLGSAEYFWKNSVGSLYQSMSDLKGPDGKYLDPKTARAMATGFGSIVAAIEYMSLYHMAGLVVPSALKNAPGISRFLSLPEQLRNVTEKAFAKTTLAKLMTTKTFSGLLLRQGANYAGQVFSESLEEGEQQFVSELSMDVARWVAGTPTRTIGESIRNALSKGVSTTAQSVPVFATGMLPGAMLGVGVAAAEHAGYSLSPAGRRAKALEAIEKAAASGEETQAAEEVATEGNKTFEAQAQTETPVFAPKAALEEFFQSAPEAAALAEEMGILKRAEVKGTGEVVMTSGEFKRLAEAAPDLTAKLGQDLRYGTSGETVRELHAKLQKQDRLHDPLEQNTPEAKAAVTLRETMRKQFVEAGQSDELAAMNADLYSRYVYRRVLDKQASGREATVEGEHKLQVRKWEEAQLKGDTGNLYGQERQPAMYEQRLNQDEKQWSQVIDNLAQTDARVQTQMMRTPLVFTLVTTRDGSSVSPYPLFVSAGKLQKIQRDHPYMTNDVLKQIPRALADPIAIFRSAENSKNPNGLVAMLELRVPVNAQGEKDTVIAALHLNAKKSHADVDINVLTSAYAKANERVDPVKPNPKWFTSQEKLNNLVYVNTEKSSAWSQTTGVQFPSVATKRNFLANSIKTEADLVKARKEGGNQFYQSGTEVKRQGKLKQDRVEWGRAVDRFVAGEMDQHAITRVMDMPLALQLAGAPVREIVADYKFFAHTLQGKHSEQISTALMKKLVTSLADPIMVFDSDSHTGTSLVAMLELQDKQGATVVVPVRLQMNPGDPNSPAILSSFYGKGNSSTGIPSNRWFVHQIEKGNLKYINTKKSTRWSSAGGLQLPKVLAPSGPFKDSIKTEADLVKARKEGGNQFYQSGTQGLGEPLVREGLTRKSDDAQAQVVHMAENAVPEFDRIRDFRNWLKSILMADGNPPVKIVSTGDVAGFTKSNIEASLKRSRSSEHRNAYATLRRMISLAEYDHYEPADAKHPYVQGQDVYYSALSVGDKLYSVKLKLDVLPETGRSNENVTYKDHRLAEIEIAPALYRRVLGEAQGSAQEADAISTVSLGILRGDVKPSAYDGAHLSQDYRGSIQFTQDGRSLVTLFKNADASTFVHEMGHMLLNDLIADGTASDASERAKSDLALVADYLGLDEKVFKGSDKERLRIGHEKFARSFEAYLLTGQAPSMGLKGVFARFRKMLLSIYADVRALDVELSPEITELFDRLLATPEEMDARMAEETTVNQLAVEEELGRQRLEELEREMANAPEREETPSMPNDGEQLISRKLAQRQSRIAYEEGRRAERQRGTDRAKEAYQRGKAMARDQILRKIERLKEARERRQALRSEVKSILAEIKKAAADKEMSWATSRELRELLEDYTLRKPRKDTLQRAADLKAYLESNPEVDLADFDKQDIKLLHMLETTTLGDMTMADLRGLSSRVQELHRKGKWEYVQWEGERKQRRDDWLGKLMDDITKMPAKEKEGTITSSDDLRKQYEGVTGALAKVKDSVLPWTLGANRLFDWIGGGKGTYQSSFTKFFVDRVNEARDGMLRHVFDRRQQVEAAMAEFGITPDRLATRRHQKLVA